MKQVTSTSQKENIHRRAQWIDRFLDKQKLKHTPRNLEILQNYNDDMIISSMVDNTRYKNLCHFDLLTEMLQLDWEDVTEADLRALVAKIMIKHGENGKETNYTFVLKMSLRAIIRFVKLGSRGKPEDGELDIVKFIKSKKPKDKLTREDLQQMKKYRKF